MISKTTTDEVRTTNSNGRCARQGDVKLTDWIRAGTTDGGAAASAAAALVSAVRTLVIIITIIWGPRGARECARVPLLLPLVKTVSHFVAVQQKGEDKWNGQGRAARLGLARCVRRVVAVAVAVVVEGGRRGAVATMANADNVLPRWKNQKSHPECVSGQCALVRGRLYQTDLTCGVKGIQKYGKKKKPTNVIWKTFVKVDTAKKKKKNEKYIFI